MNPSLRKVFNKLGRPNNSKHLEAIPMAEQDSKKLGNGPKVARVLPFPPNLGDCFNPFGILVTSNINAGFRNDLLFMNGLQRF